VKHLSPTVFLAAVALIGCSRSPSPSPTVSAPSPVLNVVRHDSLPLCQRDAKGSLSNTPCLYVRDDRPDVNGAAIVVNQEVICPIKTAADSVAMVDPARLRRIKPESILTIEIIKTVPDSIQRRCAEQLRKVIYLVTK